MKLKYYRAPEIEQLPVAIGRNFCESLHTDGDKGIEGWNWDSDETDWELK